MLHVHDHANLNFKSIKKLQKDETIYQNVSCGQVSVDEVHLGQVLHPVGDPAHHSDQLHDLNQKMEIFIVSIVFPLESLKTIFL